MSAAAAPGPVRRGLTWLAPAPNVLSVLRLLLAGAFPWLPESWWGWAIIAAGASDFIDGFLARRFGLASWVGGILDAAADKLFTLMVLGTFLAAGRLPWWAVVLVLARDLAVAIVVGYAAGLRRWDAFRRMPSRLAGKATTAFLLLLLLVVAIWPAARAEILGLVAVTGGCSIIAGADYLHLFIGELRQERRPG